MIGYQQRGELDRVERPQQSPPIDHIERSESDPVPGTFLKILRSLAGVAEDCLLLQILKRCDVNVVVW